MLVVPSKETRQIAQSDDSLLESTFGTDHPPVSLDFGACFDLKLI